MTVSVVVPWREGCWHREQSWRWVQQQYAATFPSWEVIVGRSADGPFSRSQAIIDGATNISIDADVIVVADADVWPADRSCFIEAIDAARETGWAVPHRLIHRLSEQSSYRFMGGAPLDGLELDTSNRQDSKPYVGHATGTLLVILPDVLFEVSPDRRFVGWGQEDDAWAFALRTLVGSGHRGTADLVHLWHPPQERKNRRIGNEESQKLFLRYQFANRKPDLMRALIEEAA